MNLKRMLIDRMENRILIGTIAFLGTMVLVGWVAINEPGRMASFSEQYLGRSVAVGAELYASQCVECHGPMGLGLAGAAPGLNNPQLFGVDFFADIDSEIAVLETTAARIETLEATLASEEATADMTSTQIGELEAELAALTEEFGDDPLAAIDEQIAQRQADRESLLAQMQPAIDRGYDPESPSRLNELEWGGTLDAFVHTTLVSGRPVSISYWPRPMPAWSQTAGGPLREDQLQDLTNYVMNWGVNREWTMADLLAVQQFAKVPGEGGDTSVEAIAPEVANIQQGQVENLRDQIDESMERVLADLEGVTGDPNNGQSLYNGSLACSACHNNASVAPPTEGTWTRVNETRLNNPELEGYTAEHYLVESILVPNAFVAPGYPANAMPQNFGEVLDAQSLADLLAYIESQDQPDPLAN